MQVTGYTTKIRLYAPNGTLIQQAAEGVFSDISLTLPATGTYVLIASNNDVNTIGSYTLVVTSESTGTPILFGTPVTSTIASTGELDQYTFSANTGDSLITRIGATWQYYPRLRLYAPNGTLLSTCVGLRPVRTYHYCTTGTYLLT